MAVLFLLLSLIQLSFADLDLMKIDNLNANYTKPYGRGEVDKINVDFSSPFTGQYAVEIFREEKSFKIDSPFFTLNWLKPWPFIHNADGFGVEKAYVSFGKKDHSLSASKAYFSLDNLGPFSLKDILGKCKGVSVDQRVENRLMDDCLKNAEFTISELDVPVDFILSEIVSGFQPEPMPIAERPADNFKFTVKDGDFSMMVYTRVIFYAGLRAWGNVSLQNNRKTLVVRIDQIRFGYIPITSIVMKELAKRNRNPDVMINDRYIVVNF